MSHLTDAVNALRRELLQQGSRAAAELFTAHKTAFDATQAQLERLLARIAEAQKAGEPLSQSWLFRQNRLEALQQQALAEMTAFARLAERRVTTEQQAAVGRSQDDAKQLAFAALEDAGRVMPAVTTNWNRLPTEALTDLVGALQDGSPLRALFDDFGLQASEGMRSALIAGLATGASPRDIGRNIRKVLDIGLTRAQTIARTETLRAYRSASLRTYEENADVVSGWMWMASLSPRTCPMCLSMHGKRFPLTTPFGSHCNCRCAVVSIVPGLPPLRTGEDWLQAQSAETQEAVLGVKAAESWRKGDVTLEDFVGVKQSERWGTTRFVVSLDEALFKASLRTSAKPPVAPTPAPVVVLPSVADGYTLPKSGRYRTIAERSLAAIDTVHKDGKLPEIPVVSSQSRSYHGAYYRGSQTGKSVKVTLSAHGDHSELTFCHETGHYLDWEALGDAGKWGSSQPELKGFLDAVKSSRAIQDITAMSKQKKVAVDLNGSELMYSVDTKYLNYLLQPHEIWARAYAQYIATRSKDPVLLEQLAKLVTKKSGKLHYATQWEEDDFAPIAKEIDRLFAQKGWRS